MINVIIIGDSYVNYALFPADSRLFYIGRCREWGDIDVVEYILEFPATFDIEEYDKKEEEITSICRDVESKYGNIDFVIGISEYTLLVASKVRESLKIPGRSVSDIIPFRNKAVMRDRICSARLLKQCNYFSPTVADSTFRTSIFCNDDYPLVIKPCSQAGSRFVSFIDNESDLLEAIDDMNENKLDYIIENKIAGEIIHIDGLYRDGELKFICASKYVYDCMSWISKNTPMSSIQITGENTERNVIDFANKVLASIGTNDVVFHLEAFAHNSDPIQLLEIAARPGGAAIVPAIKVFYGIDLNEESLKIDLGIKTTTSSAGYLSIKRNATETFSWIVLPIKERRHLQIEAVSGLNRLPDSVTWSTSIEVGEEYNKEFWEDKALAKFVLVGNTTDLLRDMWYLEESISVDFKVIHKGLCKVIS
ncbi:ATP-grasp domain-containing protein [Providencia huaxiensis]|uniref:ATP-grasp domain-containing protein n=1 Tax=Providencia huaxiensis TaxID=2027290 RepID=A0A8I2IQ98_9GAMM|nr:MULTISPECIES: ATP-grasp domain-containing protein [Providencia]MBQ0269794.1 ATP-grasp domain-containing protein [Providencia huaxiensis]MBQ0536030.1 ATP-grasp domain-containing protein [Providencia huaxiensis]MBQ0588103.1 ATP-grasp domain-containing protein [Providencia huaxiensis]MCD2528475.1 ATP-grasp domain-containing protein [Providencia huaxiensis]